MILKLIEDIEKALDHDCYFAALALALTLPDICGKVEFPNYKHTQRYIEWFNKYIAVTEQCPDYQYVPYLTGKIVHKLRCAILHEGNPNISEKEGKDECFQIDQFVLIREKKNAFDIYGDSAHMSWYTDGTSEGKTKCVYKMNIRRLCLILCSCAKGYYKENKEKFKFCYTIEDYDPEARNGY